MISVRFRNRRDAGGQLASRLEHLRAQHPVVLGLPRGGVPIGATVAHRLEAPLDVIIVRKVGVPYHRELAMGAVGEEGALVLDQRLIRMAEVSPEQVERVVAEERREVVRRAERYRAGRVPVSIAGRCVVIVDDGIATGSTARAAIAVARARGASRVVLAAPVASAETARELGREVDELVVVSAPESFMAVGQFYDDFSPTSDDEVTALLAVAAPVAGASPRAGADATCIDEVLAVPLADATLAGHLVVPAGAPGTVLFAHGSGSSSRSPRNVFVAERLHAAGIGTLLFDLLTPSEEQDRRNVFDIGLLTERLVAVTTWLRSARPEACTALGYFGASTGAAAALRAAADRTVEVDAVVSRGGRADLASDSLAAVRCPTLLVVGGHDDTVLDLNRAAAEQLRCEHEVVVVPGASHLFEEPGALEEVARLAAAWFRRHLGSPSEGRARA